MSFPRYSKYKQSGVAWLGDVPEDWDVVQSRRYFQERKEGAREGDAQLTSSQKYGVIYQEEFMKLENQRVTQVIKGQDILKHVEPNDFVISMRSFQGGIEWCGYRGCISSAYVMLIPSKEINSRFFYYLFKSSPYIQALQSTSNLVRDGQALRYANFVQVDLPLLPYEEQEAIAAFLDRETAKIDALVAEQERLIDLLKEKRQAIISHAVTKGLNPKAPMKPSGIDWLGDIPAHWETKPLKYNVRLQTEKAGQDFFPVGLENIEGWTGKFIDTQTEFEGAGVAFVKGDILFGKLRPYLAKIYLAEFAGAAVGDFHVLRPNSHMDGRYALYQMLNRQFIDTVNSSTYGSKMPRASWDFVGMLYMPTPPKDEQIEICKYLDLKLVEFDDLEIKAQKAIDLLQERRTALISAAVTGKIDVRGIVSHQNKEAA